MSDSMSFSPDTPKSMFNVVEEAKSSVNVMIVGNSISSPAESTSYGGKPEDHFAIRLATKTGWKVQTFAHGATGTKEHVANAARIDSCLVQGARNFLFHWEGFKDINNDHLTAPNALDRINAFIVARVRAGWKVLAGTVIACESPHVHKMWNEERLELNRLMREMCGAHAVVDLAAIQDFKSMTHCFMSDLMHLSPSGNDVVADELQKAIRKLI